MIECCPTSPRTSQSSQEASHPELSEDVWRPSGAVQHPKAILCHPGTA